MKRRIIYALGMVLAVSTIISGCGKTADSTGETTSVTTTQDESSVGVDKIKNEADKSTDEVTATIKLKKTSAECDSDKVVIEDRKVRIVEPGTYTITGQLKKGQIVVDAGDNSEVRLILDNASVDSETTSPLCILSSGDTTITLTKNSINNFADADSYDGDDKAQACIFSNGNLTIEGAGGLNVTGCFKNGIESCKNINIQIVSCNITSKLNAIYGHDSVVIDGGVYCITSDEDGIKSDNDKNSDKGFVNICSGSFMMTTGDDAIEAVSSLTAKNCSFIVTAGGQKANCKGKVSIENEF